MVREGVTSNAVCCHAPSLECHLLEHISSDNEQVCILIGNMQRKCINVHDGHSLTFPLKSYPLPSSLFKVMAPLSQVEVSCPSGWTLTDCSAVSRGSAILGPVAKGNSCFVRSATGAEGAAGIAVCCRIRQPQQPTTSPHS